MSYLKNKSFNDNEHSEALATQTHFNLATVTVLLGTLSTAKKQKKEEKKLSMTHVFFLRKE